MMMGAFMNFKYAIVGFICFGLGGLMPEYLKYFLVFYTFFVIYFFYKDLKKSMMGG